jgi:hypothetical protein
MRKIIENIFVRRCDADDIIRKETCDSMLLMLVSVSLDLNRTALKQGDQHLSNHHLSNPAILYCLSYITPTCYLC